MNHNYIRPGGVAADLPPGWEDDVAEICEVVPRGVAEYDEILTENPIWLERTVGIGVTTTEQALALGASGPILRSASGWSSRTCSSISSAIAGNPS